MTVSVILPFYNSEKTLVTALESVRQQKNADAHFEVILINDGSTDRSREIAEKFISQHPDMNITLLSQENKGVAAARNAGLRVAKGDYIAFLDADDEWFPEKTERQLKFLRAKDNKIDLLASRRNNSKILFPYIVQKNNLALVTFNKLLLRNEIQPSTVIFKRKLLQNTGLFDDSQRYAEDVNFFLKATKLNTLFILNENLLIAGGGKRSFGVSGLSANLIKMKQGFQKNALEMYNMGRINYAAYSFFYFFYELKYWILLLRRTFYNITEKK